MRKVRKPSSSRPILIYFEFRSKPSLITVICMDPRPTNYLRQNIVFWYTLRWYEFLFLYFFIFRFFVILRRLIFTKIILLLLLLLIFFAMKITFIFSCSGMFRNVPECSGMFRNVPCFGFYRRPSGNDLLFLIDLLPPPLPPRHFTMPAHPCNSYRSLAWTWDNWFTYNKMSVACVG